MRPSGSSGAWALLAACCACSDAGSGFDQHAAIAMQAIAIERQMATRFILITPLLSELPI
jgi:hypothetical protein